MAPLCFFYSYFAAFARRLLCLAAAFLWINPFRDARSRSLTAASFSSAFPPADARFSAVRSADLWARFLIAAARDLRMFFFAEAIFGTNWSPKILSMMVATKCAFTDGLCQAITV